MRGVGIDEYRGLMRLMELADSMGFTFDQSPFTNDNRFVITPKDSEWPSYSRNARIYLGDMDEIESFLHGIKMARDYYMVHLKLFTQKRLDRKEQDVRNQFLMDKLTIKDQEVPSDKA